MIMIDNEKLEEFLKLRKLASQGDGQAYYNLGCYYFCGLVVDKDVAKAADYHFSARQRGVDFCFEKEGEAYTPKYDEFIKIYKQMSNWVIKYTYSYYYECCGGCGDDYAVADNSYHPFFYPGKNIVEKIILDKDGNFIAVTVKAAAHSCILHPTFYVDGKIEGRNYSNDICPEMDGMEDWGYRDSYELIKKEDVK